MYSQNKKGKCVMKKKMYMSLSTGEVVEGKLEVIKMFFQDLIRCHYINAKWMEEGKATILLREGRL